MTFGRMLPGAVIVEVALAGGAGAQPAQEPSSPTSNLEWQVGGFLDVGSSTALDSRGLRRSCGSSTTTPTRREAVGASSKTCSPAWWG